MMKLRTNYSDSAGGGALPEEVEEDAAAVEPSVTRVQSGGRGGRGGYTVGPRRMSQP